MALLALAACGPSSTPTPEQPSPKPIAVASTSTGTSAQVAAEAPPIPSPQPAGAVDATVPNPLPILYLPDQPIPESASECRNKAKVEDRTRCLIALRYEADPAARDLALDLFDSSGSIAGVEKEYLMAGGFRGTIRIVPELPIGRHRKQLSWVARATRTHVAFFEGIERVARQPVRYRYKSLAYRFLRSVGRTTPSAYAADWTIGYNVSGSLHSSEEAVTDTLFHEVFHLNDAEHGDWSSRVLRPVFDAIVARCGTKVACLRPYAPGDTMVKGGTFYAFQPNNGDSVHEYAAELATRYFREQDAVLRSARFPRPPFKCGPDENRRAWGALVGEFFGGVDATPACVPPP